MTLFPEMIEGVAATSILGRAINNGYISVEAVDIRDYTTNKHNRVDDYTYGGDAGDREAHQEDRRTHEGHEGRRDADVPVRRSYGNTGRRGLHRA